MTSIGTGYDLSASTYSPDGRIFQATSGLVADARHVGNRAREEAENYRDTYRAPTPVKALADRIGLYVQAYTLYSSVRPFGISALFGGVDGDGPQLYVVEPSGIFYGYHGAAVGKGRQLAKTEMEKLKLSELTIKEAVYEAARIIHLVHDDSKDKEFELELSWVGEETGGLHLPVPHDLWVDADKKGKEALDEDMED
ncbi:hypothetical protein FRB90_011298 [Tulasnella sp. 427]|nr:hypothetical protein FRB90_011298 [Tulasnella sp. 427]